MYLDKIIEDVARKILNITRLVSATVFDKK